MRCSVSLVVLLALAACSQKQALRVCADPNNLPFSNAAGQGLENRIAELIAKDLGTKVEYTWWAQRRGNVRETLKAERCDLIPGIGADVESVAATRPYYRSTYVAVTRAGTPAIHSFDDPRLRDMRIGVQMIGDDFSNTPPAHALAARGLTSNVRGFMVYGDYAGPAPQAAIIDAVIRGDLDVAFVWGPVAGFYAQRSGGKLQVTPVEPRDGRTGQPMAFAVAMGLRHGDDKLRDRVDAALARHQPEVDRLLAAYAFPLAPIGLEDRKPGGGQRAERDEQPNPDLPSPGG